MRSLTTARRSAVIDGVCTLTAGTSGPRLSVPKALSTSLFRARLVDVADDGEAGVVGRVKYAS
jgi:hypothetical protein